ncbi:MAG: ABC transporter permease [Austwickia sp.]|jgi:ABC-2 type transport system permease protein|nr:ABC transporter permease [Austwickia sp.]MBK8436036.1 ABC transporter permease [Austwickia sp.]MBK9101716.1 ABC transporter permease [Austwickia sp.]
MTGTSIPATVVRGALRHVRIALRIEVTSWNVIGWFLFPAIGLVAMRLLDGNQLVGSAISVAAFGLPGLVAMSLVTTGGLAVAGQLVTEREDGTLLRAKAVPHGMASHLLANTVFTIAITLVPIVMLLIVAGFWFDGVGPQGASGWARLLGFAVLGMMAVLPLGAIIGAVLPNSTALAWVGLVFYGWLAISGVFYPITALPGWLQYVGQALPTYWVGLGLRSSMLPEAAMAVEIGQSWRTGTTFVVLAAWAVAGLLLAPVLLRRMARRQSGSIVAAARDRVLNKGY